MPLPEDLRGAWWTPKIARAIFPWLIWLAKNHRTISYSEVDEEVVSRHIHKHVNFVQYGHPAGTVGNALSEIAEEWRAIIPPLNALMVRRNGPLKGIPGKGCDWYLANFLDREIDFDKLPTKDKRAIVEEVHDAIFAYKKWYKVQSYFSDVTRRYPELKPFNGQFVAISTATPPRPRAQPKVPWDFVPPPRQRQPKVPESPEHLALNTTLPITRSAWAAQECEARS
jgi:hypothetical protein